MATLLYKCPNCGGALVFDPKTGKYRCEACSSVFEESALSSAAQDKEDYVEGMAIYNCPSCGAEITADATTGALRCYYCHSPLVLAGKFENEMKPDALLTFTVQREEAREKFIAWVKKQKFLPKGFGSPSSIDNLTGVYFPYWVAEYELDAHFEGEGRIVRHTTTIDEEITTTQIFHLVRDGVLNYRNVTRGALKKADRKLADGVFPYPLDKTVDFQPGYLSGFVAEGRDIQREEVAGDIENEIYGYADSVFSNDPAYTSVSGNTEAKPRSFRYRYTLLPAWVLTYLGEGKTLYSFVVNGRTGEICGRLPINKGKLWLNSLLWGAVLCALLCVGGYFLW